MIESRFAERSAVLGIGKRIGHRALCQRNTHYAVRYAREVQHFEDQIDSRVSRAEKIALAVSQLHFSGRNRAGRNLVFQPPNEIVELTIVAASRYQEQRQPAHPRPTSFRPRTDDGYLLPAI